jgi:c-di-GMP-binding flagellar brake protein YcgR
MSSIERRQYPRVSLTHVTVEVYDAEGQPNNPEFCFIINVSENGMLFKSESLLDIYSKTGRVRLTFSLPDNNLIIRTDALIIHIESTEMSKYVGVQFKNIESAQQAFLRNYVKKSARA